MTTPITGPARILGTLPPTRTWHVAPPATPTPTLAQALDDLIRLRHLPDYLRHTGDPKEAAAVAAIQAAWQAHRDAERDEREMDARDLEARLEYGRGGDGAVRQ